MSDEELRLTANRLKGDPEAILDRLEARQLGREPAVKHGVAPQDLEIRQLSAALLAQVTKAKIWFAIASMLFVMAIVLGPVIALDSLPAWLRDAFEPFYRTGIPRVMLVAAIVASAASVGSSVLSFRRRVGR